MEIALVEWKNDSKSRGVFLNGFILKLQAEKLQAEANKHLSEPAQLQPAFSNGCIHSFRIRHNMKCRRVYGEANSADYSAIPEALPRVIEKISKQSPANVRSADDFGLFLSTTSELVFLANFRFCAQERKLSHHCARVL